MNSNLSSIVQHIITQLDLGNLKEKNGQENHYTASYFSTPSYEAWLRAVRLWLEHAQEMLKDQPPRSCPACDKNASDPIYTSYDGHDYHACRECGCWFVPYLVDEKLFQRFFSLCPEAGQLAEDIAKTRLTSENTSLADKSRFEELLSLLSKLGKTSLLDIGANAGQFVAEATASGWKACGLETDPFALALAREHGLPVVGNVESLPHDDFEVITIWESIEHIADPHSVLSSSLTRLKKGGAVALTFPNLNNAMLQQLRGDTAFSHGGYNTPGHINHFGKEQMRILLERAGLTPIFWDAMYSSDFILQYGYLAGKTQGARQDIHSSSKPCFTYPAQLASIIPYLALLEKESLTAPILFCLACRDSEAHMLHDAVQSLEHARAQYIQSRLEELAPPAPEITIEFRLEARTSLRLAISAGNHSPESLDLFLTGAWIEDEQETVRVQFNSFRRIFPGAKILARPGGGLWFSTDNACQECMLTSKNFTLPSGRYTLHLQGASLTGQCGAGLIETASKVWFTTPRPMCRHCDAASLGRLLRRRSLTAQPLKQETLIPFILDTKANLRAIISGAGDAMGRLLPWRRSR